MTNATIQPASHAFALSPQIMTNTKEMGLFCKDVLQGLLSGVMVVSGSTHLMASDLVNVLPAALNGSFLEGGSLAGLLQGQSMGVLQLLIAALLFVSTRRGIARTLGILALVAYLGANSAGLMVQDFTVAASSALRGLANMIEATGMTVGM